MSKITRFCVEKFPHPFCILQAKFNYSSKVSNNVELPLNSLSLGWTLSTLCVIQSIYTVNLRSPNKTDTLSTVCQERGIRLKLQCASLATGSYLKGGRCCIPDFENLSKTFEHMIASSHTKKQRQEYFLTVFAAKDKMQESVHLHCLKKMHKWMKMEYKCQIYTKWKRLSLPLNWVDFKSCCLPDR